MDSLGKYLSLCLVVILAVSNLLITTSTYAQLTSTQKPTPPEFTLTFIPASENVTRIDSLTGVKTYEIIDKSTIEVKIKNQPFIKNIDGVNYYLFYSIFVAGHFDPSNQKNWRTYYSLPSNYTGAPPEYSLQATDTQYTTVSIGGDYPSNAQVDVTVSAMLMHDGQFRVHDYMWDMTGHIVSGVIQGEGNSNKQTFTIPEHLASSTEPPNPTSVITSPPTSVPSEPNINENSISMPLVTFTAIIATLLSIIIILLVLILVRTRRQTLPASTCKSL
jgi:hypothetical protein